MSEVSKGGMPGREKSAPPKREETSMFRQGKDAGRRKKIEESRRRKGGAPCKGKSATRGIEEEFVGDTEEKS